jgi:hypothetical protein
MGMVRGVRSGMIMSTVRLGHDIAAECSAALWLADSV